MKSIFDKSSDELNLMLAFKMERRRIKKFVDSLTDLQIIKQEIGNNRK